MIDLILIAVLVVIIGLPVAYIIKAKKAGVKCIGCSSGSSCNSESSCCSCGGACNFDVEEK